MDIAKLNIRGYQPAKDNTSAQFLLCISSLGHRHKPYLKIISETETIETTDLFSFLGYESEPTMIFNLIYLPYKFIYIFIIFSGPPFAVRRPFTLFTESCIFGGDLTTWNDGTHGMAERRKIAPNAKRRNVSLNSEKNKIK